LFQYAERLQERKADRENVATEMDVKADKHALDGKVNQSTFDETFQMFDRGMIHKRKNMNVMPLKFVVTCALCGKLY
jgi:hypothetical protein